MTDLADREWRLVREEARSGAMNMALDEVAAETAAAGGPRTVRLYRWSPSCLTLGYRQDPATVDWDHCEAAGVEVTRRQTGGGGIYHDDHGDVSYSVAVPAEEVPGDLLDCYHLLCEPVLRGFDALDVDADYVVDERPAVHRPACYLRGLNPAHDLVDDDGRGRKLAGNAQYRRDDAVIQHGSITHAVAAGAHLAVFADPGVDAEGFRERVAGVADLVDVDRAETVRAFEEALSSWVDAEPGSWTDDELARARDLATTKYRADEWVRDRSDPTA